LYDEYHGTEPLTSLPDPFHKTIKEINSLESQAALTNPLYWGIVDLREEKVSPLPNHPRAKDLLSKIELQKLRDQASAIIKKEYCMGKSVQALFDALPLSSAWMTRMRGYVITGTKATLSAPSICISSVHSRVRRARILSMAKTILWPIVTRKLPDR